MTKVKIIPVVSYRVETEDSRSLGNFDKDSQWEGMTKLVHRTGVKSMIVESPHLLDEMFGAKEYIAHVISASSGIFPEKNETVEETATTSDDPKE